MPYRPDYLRLSNPDLCPHLEHWFPLGETLVDSVTSGSATLADGVALGDREVTTLGPFQEWGTYAGYDPDVPNTVADEPIVLASSPGTGATGNELTVAGFFRVPKPGFDAILSLSDRSSGYSWEMGGGSAGGVTSQQFEVRISQDGSTVNKRFRTTSTIFRNVEQTSFPTSTLWTHLAFTYSTVNQQVKLYVNGYLAAATAVENSGSWGVFDSSADLILGNYDGGSVSTQMPLAAFQLGVWSKVLSDREILALAKPLQLYVDPTEDTYLGVIPPNVDDSAAYTAAQLAVDTMGSGSNHATLHHLPWIKWPHGTWYLSQAIVLPNTSSGGAVMQGAGRNSQISTSTGAYTILRASASWTGDSIGLIEDRGSNWRVKDIGFYDSAGTPARVGVHLTRGPSGSGSAPSNLTVDNCSGNGLVSLVKGGWDSDENNCDFIKVFHSVVASCTYLFHCVNEQGQIHTVEHCIGSPTTALCYLQQGGPLYVAYSGTGGADLVRAGSLSPVTGHIVIEKAKLDAGVSNSTLFFNGLNAPDRGGGFVTIRDVLRTVGTRGVLGKSFHANGEWRLTVEDCAGVGGTGVESPGGDYSPFVSYVNCQWYHGDVSDAAGGYTLSAAYLVANDPTILFDTDEVGGEGPDSGTLAIHNASRATRVATGSLPNSPARFDSDTPESGEPTTEEERAAEARAIFAQEYARRISPNSPQAETVTYEL